MGQIHQLSVLKNEVMLEHSHTHSFMYCLWLFSHYNSSYVVVIDTVRPTKPEIPSGPLEKMLTNSFFIQWQLLPTTSFILLSDDSLFSEYTLCCVCPCSGFPPPRMLFLSFLIHS